MSPGRHDRLSRLFLEALDLDPARQAAFLAEACPDDATLRDEVVDLLNRDRRAGPALGAVAGAGVLPAIPGYTLLGLLGEGGMGVVYEAEQESPRRRVAVKVLRSDFISEAMLKRFAHEAQVLAQLEHPAIARIYQAGRAGERESMPFFVMELVRGVALHEAARRDALGTKARLDLFARVCDGVEHAHQKGVIHRDLKPANIFVTDAGDPKILDFGIARVTHADMQVVTIQTDAGQIVGTLSYMSPEQATSPSHALDTRTDVYSLGVVLYQLLTGVLPHDLAGHPLPEALRIISDVEPRPVSDVDPALRGDVATIVRKAMAKDREHRYQTAAELAADVRRHLRDEPIVARPTTAFQALRRFARRNKAMVAGLAVAVIALVAGTVVSMVFAVRAKRESVESERQKQVAEIEARSSRRFVDFIIQAFHGLDVSAALATEPTLREAMDRVGERLGVDLADEPLIQARLHAFLGNMYRNLGLAEKAGEHFAQAITVYDGLGVENPDVVDALQLSSWFLFKAGQLAEAEAQVGKATAMLTRLGQDGTELAARCTSTAAEIAAARRDFPRAAALIDEALRVQRQVFSGDHEDIATSLLIKGQVSLDTDDPETAERMVRESMAMRTRLYGPEHPLVAESLQGLSVIDYDRGDLDAAESSMRAALAIREKTLPEGHPALASGYANLGILNYDRKRYDVALEYIDKAAGLYKVGYGAETPHMGPLLTRRAHVLSAMGRYDEATVSAGQALDVLRKHLDDGHRSVVVARVAYGMLERRAGRKEQALAALLPGMEALRAWEPADAAGFQTSRLETGALAYEVGRYAEAEAVLQDALAEVARAGSTKPREVLHMRTFMGLALLAQNRAGDAEPHLLAALESARKIEDPPGGVTARIHDALVEVYEALGQPDRAAEYRGTPAAESRD